MSREDREIDESSLCVNDALVCLISQRSGQRGGFIKDGIEKFISLRRDGRPLSAAGEMHSGFLHTRDAATHGPRQHPLSTHVIRKLINNMSTHISVHPKI